MIRLLFVSLLCSGCSHNVRSVYIKPNIEQEAIDKIYSIYVDGHVDLDGTINMSLCTNIPEDVIVCSNINITEE